MPVKFATKHTIILPTTPKMCCHTTSRNCGTRRHWSVCKHDYLATKIRFLSKGVYYRLKEYKAMEFLNEFPNK